MLTLASICLCRTYSVSVVIDSLMSSYGALAKRNNPDMVEAISQDNLVALRLVIMLLKGTVCQS